MTTTDEESMCGDKWTSGERRKAQGQTKRLSDEQPSEIASGTIEQNSGESSRGKQGYF